MIVTKALRVFLLRRGFPRNISVISSSYTIRYPLNGHRHGSTGSESKPILLDKPSKYNAPSHPTRHNKKSPRQYGPSLTAKEKEAQSKKRYPYMFPPEGTFLHWFLRDRFIHVWIILVWLQLSKIKIKPRPLLRARIPVHAVLPCLLHNDSGILPHVNCCAFDSTKGHIFLQSRFLHRAVLQSLQTSYRANYHSDRWKKAEKTWRCGEETPLSTGAWNWHQGAGLHFLEKHTSPLIRGLFIGNWGDKTNSWRWPGGREYCLPLWGTRTANVRGLGGQTKTCKEVVWNLVVQGSLWPDSMNKRCSGFIRRGVGILDSGFQWG